jgi:hypothetical protein
MIHNPCANQVHTTVVPRSAHKYIESSLYTQCFGQLTTWLSSGGQNTKDGHTEQYEMKVQHNHKNPKSKIYKYNFLLLRNTLIFDWM